jgi:hypothetical protein
MKPKKSAAPSDERRPLPLSSEEINLPRVANNDHERGKIHRMLLIESVRRLRAGRTLEREHGVIHPEMTAISRDILRLTDLVFPGGPKPDADGATSPAEPVELTDGARALCELLARATSVRVAKACGLDPKDIVRWSRGDIPDAPARATLEARLRIARSSWGDVGR